MSSDEEVLARAHGYPYEAPERSYRLCGREVHPLEDPGAALVSAEVALLAYGSNAAPEVLRRKTAARGFPPAPALAAVRAELRDLDVVYSAHVSPYGAVPATLQRSPGTVVPAFVLLLSARQLEALRATEPNYALASVARARVEVGGQPLPRAARAFVSRHGCLALGGREVALEAVRASRRRLAAMDEPGVLAAVAERLARPGEGDAIVLEAARSPARAEALTRELRRKAVALRGL